MLLLLRSYPIDIHCLDGNKLKVIKIKLGTVNHILLRSMINKKLLILLVTRRRLSVTHEILD